MVRKYVPQEIEQQWQAHWEADKLYETPQGSPRPKWYYLTMFPYTSGDLHIGHWYIMAPSDTQARYMRMKGYNVFFPIGFDAFGLPAENAAIQRGIHPHTWTMDNIENMRRQLRSMGAMFDWRSEVITCLPEYYRWNQWIFLQFYKAGLAYRAQAPANWCPSCQTVLANEQVMADGTCERCHSSVTKRDLEQWFFRITRYAEELLDHSRLQWPERICVMQKNWIGRSTGVEVAFDIEGHPNQEIQVFTTRIDTIFGVTFMVLAPEHPLVAQLTAPERRAEVQAHVEATRRQSEIERLSTEREQTGVFISAYAINRLNGRRLPIYIADYVLLTYGTGCVMGVPAHDTRDFAFAQRYGLPIPVVIAPPGWKGEDLSEAYLEPGTMVNSGPFNGLPSEQGKEAIADYLEAKGRGRRAVSYRLRDWLISRQRYWGTPIPIIYCAKCGMVPVPEEDLPVILPEDAEFRPTGESPLKYHEGFVNTTCPQCGGPAKRETDTMDTFVDSSWYQMRYLNPHYDLGPFDPEKAKVWLPVDQYTGGAEHATMHLLYARFFHKALRDIGLTDTEEPYLRLFNQGQILGPDGQRMSKSRGNVVAPDDQVQHCGADAFRCSLMFMGPWEQGGPYNTKGISGLYRWLNRVWNLVLDEPKGIQSPPAGQGSEETVRQWTHKTIKRVSQDLEGFRFNTMLAALMEFTNFLASIKDTALYGSPAWREAIDALMLMLAPSTPHLAEELWALTGHPYSIHTQAWPTWDEALTTEELVTLVIQVNGRLRERVQVPPSISREEATKLALGQERVQRHLNQQQPKQVVFVPGRLINLVV